jgi:hypothetical protein
MTPTSLPITYEWMSSGYLKTHSHQTKRRKMKRNLGGHGFKRGSKPMSPSLFIEFAVRKWKTNPSKKTTNVAKAFAYTLFKYGQRYRREYRDTNLAS